VVKFIAEHKDCDSIIFQHEIRDSDLMYRLKLTELLVQHILKMHCHSQEEYDQLCLLISTEHPISMEDAEYTQLTPIPHSPILERINAPLQLALFAAMESVHSIDELLQQCQRKIKEYKQSYRKTLLALCLREELSLLKRLINQLNERRTLLLQLLPIFSSHVYFSSDTSSLSHVPVSRSLV
jgi:hypothetical protein